MSSTPRVVGDREGGFIALDRIEAGRIVALAPISPPLRVKRDRAHRRRGLRVHLVINLWLLASSLLAMVVCRGCA